MVIGGGPGGAAAAVSLATQSLAVALIEDRLVGGECHYWACNPTKTLIRSIEVCGYRSASLHRPDIAGRT